MISARVLQALEDLAGKPVFKLFDLIVGTSTGGMQAAFLTAAKSEHERKPIGTAGELVDLYRCYGPEMFSRSRWKTLSSLGGLRGPKYDAERTEWIFEAVFGDRQLRDTIPDIVVPSYDIEARSPYLFKTLRAREEPDGRNHLLRHVARATSAAPTYFPPLLLDRSQWPGEGHQRRVLVDGGVFANNPSMIGLSEAMSHDSETTSACRKPRECADELLLCSIGTGIHTRRFPYAKAKKWGLYSWARRVISVMMDGMSDATNYHAERLVSQTRYWRFDIDLLEASDDLDEVKPANLDALLREADRIVSRDRGSLKGLVKELTARVGKGDQT